MLAAGVRLPVAVGEDAMRTDCGGGPNSKLSLYRPDQLSVEQGCMRKSLNRDSSR
jgi:hypothetical protein